ncbi:hypothetical protein ACFXI0_29465, partial [Kitasatospora indigofera]
MLAVDWNPENYRDTFEQKVHELIAAKQSGQEITAPEAAPTPSNVLDLMDILGRSLESAKTASPPKTGDAKAAAKAGAKTAAAKAKSSRTEAGSKTGAAAGRASVGGHRPKETEGKKSTSTRARPATSATGKKTSTASRRREDLSGLTKSELYKKATAAHLPHRSTMTRDELQNALEKTGHGRHLHSAS